MAERLVISNVLPKMGFTDIFRPSKNFYFDALARKDDKVFAIDVTTSINKTLFNYHIEFSKVFQHRRSFDILCKTKFKRVLFSTYNYS